MCFLLLFFSHQRILQRAVRSSLEKQLDSKGPIASRWGSVQEFLMELIAAYDFPGGPDPCRPLLWIRRLCSLAISLDKSNFVPTERDYIILISEHK